MSSKYTVAAQGIIARTTTFVVDDEYSAIQTQSLRAMPHQLCRGRRRDRHVCRAGAGNGLRARSI